jgi:hypothetical protein
MKHFKLLFAFLALFGAMNANAQTDVTSQYVVNPGFEACTPATGNQAAGKTTTGIDYTDDGWTFLYDHGAETWAMSAVLSYGTDGQINGAAIPAKDNEGNTGNALGVSVGWGHSFYYQSATAITLPAGHYDLKVYAYNNNNGATQLKSLFGFVATNGTSYLSTKTSFTQGEWVTDVVSFDLTEDTEGKFQIGGQAISGGSGSNAKVFFDNISLTYTDPAQAIKDAYNKALQEAKDAIANEDYNNVTGEERSSLEDAISTYDEITSGYEDATTALKDATSAFTAAKSAYDAYVAAIQYPELPYASAEKKAAVEQACGESPATASEATEKTAAIYQALRAYYESHALAENYAGATNVTNLIQNPDATDGNNGWTWTGNKNNPRNTESWTDSKGKKDYMYFDGGNWGGTGWTTTMEQEITIPAGKYLLTAKGRAALEVTLTMSVGEESVELPNVGNAGNVFDRGWNDGSVEFETQGEPVTILVKATTEGYQQWFSVGDFRLMRLELYEEMADAADYAALNEAIAAAEAKKLGFDAGDYAPYNNTEALQALTEAKAIDQNAENGKDQVTALIEKLSNWVANEVEVNAVYDGTLANAPIQATSENVILPGWVTKSGNTRQTFSGADNDNGGKACLADADDQVGLFVHPGTYNYGETVGYTMPLKAGVLYCAEAKYCAWANESNNNFTLTILKDGATIATKSFGKNGVACTEAGALRNAKLYFTPEEDGDYVLSVIANGNTFMTDFYVMRAVIEDVVLEDAAIAAPTAEFGNVTYGRKLVEGYNTLVLPFDVTKDELGDNVEAIYAYGGSTKEGEGENAVVHLDFTQAVENLAANTPYIVKMSADQDGLAFNEKEFKTVAEPIKSDANFDFVGTYVALPAGNDVITNRDYISVKSGLKQATDGKQLKAFRAYLKNNTEEVAGAMISITIGGEVVDGIQAAQILNNVEGTIYNLNGQKVSNAQKGIFIQNGKKVVIK